MPPPMHIVTMPQRFFWRRSSSSSVPVMREPVMPYGMADRDRAAVRVELRRIDAEAIAAVDRL